MSAAALVRQCRTRWHRARYRAAMLRAIDAATEASEIWGRASRTDGLRAIRRLEQLNGRPFDPFSPVLVAVVRGAGPKLRRRPAGRTRLTSPADRPPAQQE